MSRDTQKGWFGSLLIHGILLAFLIVFHIPDIVQRDELIELSWGAVTPSAAVTAPTGTMQSASVQADVGKTEIPTENEKTTQPVELPTRSFRDMSQEAVPPNQSEKLAPSEAVRADGNQQVRSIGDREGVGDARLTQRERVPATDEGRRASSVAAAPGEGTPGGDVQEGVSFSIQWMEGGTRRKLSGNLPAYPPGETIEAQIKILAVVKPDGSIRSVQPAQKANTRLEDAAMKEIRLWRFEPLRSNQPSVDQNCIITFLFRLQ